MRFFLLPAFLLVFIHSATAQNNLLLLRKKGRTIQQFYPGINISFFLESKQLITAQVHRVSKDSIYLVQYDVRRLMTGWGSAIFDTITKYNLSFALADIKGFPAKQHFSSLTISTIMEVGAAGYAGLNIINAATQNESLTGPNNLRRLGTAAAVFATGYIWKKSKKTYLPIGRKYSLLFLGLSK